jgi:outer membrane receptor protein involved in Fe transport
MGGVINLFPVEWKEGESPSRGRLLSRYETADSGLTFHGLTGGNFGNLKVIVGGTGKFYDELRGGGNIGLQPHTDYDRQGAFLSLRYDFPETVLPGWWITAKYLFNRIDDAGRAEKLFISKKWRAYSNTDHLSYIRLHMPFQKIKTYGEFTLSYQHLFDRVDRFRVEDDFKTIIEGKTTRADNRVNTTGLDLKFITSLYDNYLHLRYGGTWYHDSVTSEVFALQSGEPGIPEYPNGSTYDTFGGFLMMEYNPLAKDLSQDLKFGAGYRFHGMSAFAPAREPLTGKEQVITPDEIGADYTGHVFFGSVHYSFQETGIIAFTLSQGFRVPNLQEYIMIGDAGNNFHVPNPDLGPERSDTYELMTRWNVKNLLGLNETSVVKDMYFGISGYYSKIKDLLTKVHPSWNGLTHIDTATPIKKHENANRGRIYGFEVWGQAAFSYGFSLTAHGTYTWGQEEKLDGTIQPMRRIPPLFGQLSFRWKAPENTRFIHYMEVFVRAAGKQSRLHDGDIDDVRIPEGGTPGWWTLNARAGLKISKSLRLNLSLENILDTGYKYHGSGVWSPGSNFILSAEYLF